MTLEAAPSPDLGADPVLAVAERQLALLGELAEMAMAAARAFAASAVASAKAAEAILDDKFFMPEIGRAQACGAKDAAESIQKVSRAVRLTLMLEMKVAEIVRDIRAGIVTHSGAPAPSRNAGEDAGAPVEGARTNRRSAGVLAGSCPENRDSDVTPAARDIERLDIEYPERLPKGAYRSLVDDLAADVGAAVDWEPATVVVPRFGETVPPPRGPRAVMPREMALSP